MGSGDQLDKIEQLKKRLYGREQIASTEHRSQLSYKKDIRPATWADKPDISVPSTPSRSWLPIFALVSALFFVGTLGVAGFILINGSNMISNRNIDFNIKAPVTAKAGDEIPVQISVVNKNKLPLEQVKLTVEYPNDTRKPGDASILLTKTKDDVGLITSGQVFNQTVQAVFFGREDDVKKIKGIIEYRIPGSNAIYSKETTFELAINSPPIDVVLSAVPEAIAGQDITMEVKVSSNADLLLKNIALNIDYPPGFKFSQATLSPTEGDNFWFLGDMKAGEEKTFKLSGTLSGQNEEVKTFEANIGNTQDMKSTKLDSVFANLFKTITVKQPFVAVNVLINGKSGEEVVIKSGEFIRVDIEWINNLNIPVTDNNIEVFLSGDILDKKQVQVESGFYFSEEDKIVWNKNTLRALQSVNPREKGKTSFYFKTFSLSDENLVGLKNPSMDIKTRINSTRVSEGFNTENITSSIERKIKMETAVGLSTQVLHKSGPVPPVVGSDTVYTVSLAVINSSNDLKDSKIVAKLPIYVKWLGGVNPANSSIVYNENTSEITWNIGVIPAGTGQKTSPREISFDVAINPSLAQVNSVIILVEWMLLQGFDTFTETMVEVNRNNIKTIK
jgi:hypothetical protein